MNNNCKKCNDTGNIGIYHPRTFELAVLPCKDCGSRALFDLQTKLLRLQNAQYAREHNIPIPENYIKESNFEG
jgi:hypothetical protein